MQLLYIILKQLLKHKFVWMHTIGFFCLVLLLSGCKTEQKPTEVNSIINDSTVLLTDIQYKNGGIETGNLELKQIGTTIKVNGKIDVPPQNMISVAAPLGGYLKYTNLLPGMHVTKGQLIAKMEDPQYVQLQQDYLLAKSKLQYAELDYKRQRELNSSQASSDKVMQQARTEATNQQILLNSIAEQLKLININPNQLSSGKITKTINIYSSISGYVSKINANVGKYINPAEAMFELINPTDIHLNLKVFENDVRKLHIGQQLWAYNNSNPDKKYSCEIILINKDVSMEGTTDVHCHFFNYDPSLLPGMYMNAEIQLNSDQHLAVNNDAIVTYEGRQYIFEELGNKKYQMKRVDIGFSENGYTALVNSSLLQNQKIVTKGAYALLMMLKNKAE